MRIKTTTAAIVFIAVVAAVAFSVIGQEEPLPVVRPRAVAAEIPLAEPTVVLAVEPIRDFAEPTLLDAARANDFVSFDALYAAARSRGEDVSRFATLHELWTYSVTDPIGAFYGRELYDRLARAYPGYEAYIADYRIIDSRGNAFYPTSETRAFLIDRIVEGQTPRVQIAEAGVVQASSPAPRVVRASSPAPRVPVKVDQEVHTTPQDIVTEPVAATPAPAPVQAPIVSKPVTPVVVTKSEAPKQPFATRGVLLVIIGLIGIGLLAVILRTPREEPLQVVQKPSNVEPLRKPAAPPAAADGTRATGSHG